MFSEFTNLAILDHQSLFRRTLSNFLSDKGNFNVSIETANVFDLIDKLQRAPVDVLLMEVFSPVMKGEDAVKVIRGKFPAVKIILLSISTDIQLISDLVDAGIHGYISKFDEPEELLRAIQAVKENRIYHNTLLTEALYLNQQNAVVDCREKSLASPSTSFS
jgi:DNA-binding NarL/FixJ family response regulator